MIKRKLPWLGFLLVSVELPAHTPKAGNVWATAGPFLHRALTSHDIGNDDASFVGGGIVAQGDVDTNGGVEIAMIYVDKLYVRQKNHRNVAEKIKRMYITTGYRHWFVPSLSAGAAFFSAYSMGDPRVILDERPSSEELETSARDITEYGFDASLQWEVLSFAGEMWGARQFAVVADARYSFSMTRKSGEDANAVGVLLGFKCLVPK